LALLRRDLGNCGAILSSRAHKAVGPRHGCPYAYLHHQIREFVPMKYMVLGTDAFGCSDTRANLRRHFEVDRYYIAQAAIRGPGGGRQDDRQGCRPRDQAIQDRREKPNPIGV